MGRGTISDRLDDSVGLSAAVAGAMLSGGRNCPAKITPVVYAIGEESDMVYATIERRVQRDGRVLWIVKDAGFVLGKDGEWHTERSPSNRDEEHILMTRMTWEEVCAVASYILHGEL